MTAPIFPGVPTERLSDFLAWLEKTRGLRELSEPIAKLVGDEIARRHTWDGYVHDETGDSDTW